MEHEVTPEQFIVAAHALGLDADLIRVRHPGEPQGVNVWKSDSGAVPDATVWWPREGHPNDQIIWGPNFDYGVHRDITAEALAQRVKETLS